MAIKISLFIAILFYAVIISQSLFYILAMSTVMKKMQAAVFIQTRQLLDAKLQTTLYTAYYLALASSIALTAISVVNPYGILFRCSVVALAALVTDIMISLKGNVPLNKAINTWTMTNYPANWEQYRSKWFSLYHTRQIINIAGFMALLAGIIFGL